MIFLLMIHTGINIICSHLYSCEILWTCQTPSRRRYCCPDLAQAAQSRKRFEDVQLEMQRNTEEYCVWSIADLQIVGDGLRMQV